MKPEGRFRRFLPTGFDGTIGHNEGGARRGADVGGTGRAGECGEIGADGFEVGGGLPGENAREIGGGGRIAGGERLQGGEQFG